jgi:hypothetical protein
MYVVGHLGLDDRFLNTDIQVVVEYSMSNSRHF